MLARVDEFAVLIAIGSVKGSPGVTSTALALAAAWPRAVVLLEADPAGGDLAYRCNAAHGGALAPHKGLLKLAASVRAGAAAADSVSAQAERLACGVDVVQGVTSAAQGRGIARLWPMIAAACVSAEHDVIADVGRLERAMPVLDLVREATVVLMVTTRALGPVMQLTDGLQDLAPALAGRRAVPVVPILIGDESRAEEDCMDLDDLLHRAGLPTRPARGVAYDPKALARLEGGEHVDRRLARSPLIRSVKTIVLDLLEGVEAAA